MRARTEKGRARRAAPAREPAREQPRLRALARPVAAGLLALYAALAVTSIREKTFTFDEVSHIPAGYTYLTRHDFRLNPEHPPLIKMLAALPLLALPLTYGGATDNAWQRAISNPHAQWTFGHAFLYRTPGNDPARLLFLARLPMVIVALALGVLLWLWARELLGEVAATGVLALFVLDPNMLAHGPLVTTDMGLATFALGVTYLLFRCARRLTPANAAGAAALLALALVAKYTAVLLGAMSVGLLALRVLRREPWPLRLGRREVAVGGATQKAGLAAALLLVMALGAWLGIWAVYGFRYAPTAEPFARLSASADDAPRALAVARRTWQSALARRGFGFIQDYRLLPQAYTFGLIDAAVHTQGRDAYLHGRFSPRGWWYYFPVALAIKTPIATIIGVIAGIVLLVVAGRRSPLPAGARAFLLVPPALFLGLAMSSELNIGLRHVLQVYPFAFLIAGVAIKACLETRRRLAHWAGALLAVWLALGTLRLHPHYLAYFNELAGGPGNGPSWLIDSNLDWGQDLKLLKRWMDSHGVPWINLCYFGNADPDSFGFEYVKLPASSSYSAAPPSQPRLPGYLAISATRLAGLGMDAGTRRGYEVLLRGATLVDKIGYSIYVYRVPAP